MCPVCATEIIEIINEADEYINKKWPEERLNEYSYYSGWHESIKEIIREVWLERYISRLNNGKRIKREKR